MDLPVLCHTGSALDWTLWVNWVENDQPPCRNHQPTTLILTGSWSLHSLLLTSALLCLVSSLTLCGESRGKWLLSCKVSASYLPTYLSIGSSWLAGYVYATENDWELFLTTFRVLYCSRCQVLLEWEWGWIRHLFLFLFFLGFFNYVTVLYIDLVRVKRWGISSVYFLETRCMYYHVYTMATF